MKKQKVIVHLLYQNMANFEVFWLSFHQALTEIGAVVLNFLPGSKILNRPTVSTHYRIQKYVKKICLHKLIVEIMLFVYIFMKFRNRLSKVKKIQKIISRHKFIVRSWFLVVSDPKIKIWKFVSIFCLHLCQKVNK